MTEKKDRPVANLTASENEPDLDEATPENQAVANVVSIPRPQGLLDLPPEIRLMIFRHLVAFPHVLDLGYWSLWPLPSVDILRTCRVIYEEAFHVLYAENRFSNCFMTLHYSLPRFPQVLNTIRNLYVSIDMEWKWAEVEDFLELMHHFGNENPSVIRGTLTIDFDLNDPSVRPLEWFIRALGRFTNFRIIELHFYICGMRDRIFDVLEYLELALEPMLGRSEYPSREGKGLRFHPVNHQNRSRVSNDGDWAGSLEGIRLKWNEDFTDEIPEEV